MVLATVHGGQFAVNAQMLGLYRRSQAGSWVVLRGPMRVVFFVDLSLAIANVAFMRATGLRHYHASFSA
jgi:hypothetical protein